MTDKPPTFRPSSIRVTDYIRDVFEALAHVNGLKTADEFAVYYCTKSLEKEYGKPILDALIRRTREDREARTQWLQEKIKEATDKLP